MPTDPKGTTMIQVGAFHPLALADVVVVVGRVRLVDVG